MGLELLHGLGGVVDQSKARRLAASKVCAQTEDADLVLVCLVDARQLVAQLILGDVRTVGVEDVPIRGPAGQRAIKVSRSLHRRWGVGESGQDAKPASSSGQAERMVCLLTRPGGT